MYYSGLIIQDEEYKIAVNLDGHGGPTEEANAGMMYLDLDSGDVYKCLGGAEWELFVPGDMLKKIETIESDVADLQYTLNPLTITKFENTVKNAKIGQTVTDITFSWALNQTPKSITLCDKNGNTISTHAVDSEGTTLSGQSVTNDTKWKLKATDKRDKAVTKETAITFLHGVYYGVGAPRDSYDSEFVNGLSVEWRTNKKPSVALSPNKEHIYYCLPTWMGACNFSVGVLPGGFELADTIMFTNEYGYEQAYYIYKSVELLEGTAIKVNIL